MSIYPTAENHSVCVSYLIVGLEPRPIMQDSAPTIDCQWPVFDQYLEWYQLADTHGRVILSIKLSFIYANVRNGLIAVPYLINGPKLQPNV